MLSPQELGYRIEGSILITPSGSFSLTHVTGVQSETVSTNRLIKWLVTVVFLALATALAPTVILGVAFAFAAVCYYIHTKQIVFLYEQGRRIPVASFDDCAPFFWRDAKGKADAVKTLVARHIQG